MDEYVKLELLGITYYDQGEEKWATATLEAKAVVKRVHRVFYEIKWESEAVRPVNPKLKSMKNEYQLDRHPTGGWTPGDWNDDNGKGYLTHITSDMWQFFFTDEVRQPNRRNGLWWFRLRIVDENENTVGDLSTEVEVDWSVKGPRTVPKSNSKW